jgi:hypothetical protein
MIQGDAAMKARFVRRAEVVFRYRRASALGLFFVLIASGSAVAQQGTPEQRKACTPDVYRLCAGEIPNVRAITACLRRQRSSLSPACAAIFPQ